MYLNSFPFAQLFELFPCSWHLWHNYCDVSFVVVVVVLWVVVGVVVVVWLVGVDELLMPLVEGPIWKLALVLC